MRSARTVLAVTLVMAALAVPALADTTKTLRIECAPTGAFAVENLAGNMHVMVGSSDKVVVAATVHGEDEATAALMKLEQVIGEKGTPTLRMVYPLDQYTTFRYPTEAHASSNWLERECGLD